MKRIGKILVIIICLTSICGEACDFSRERSCDEISHEIGQVAKELGSARDLKASETHYFKFRSQFDSLSSLQRIDRYISVASPTMEKKLLESNYQVAVCEFGLNEEKVFSLISSAASSCGIEATTECFRKYYAQQR